jgi:hypothetical protein
LLPVSEDEENKNNNSGNTKEIVLIHAEKILHDTSTNIILKAMQQVESTVVFVKKATSNRKKCRTTTKFCLTT